MKASTAQFASATALEHLHALVRSEEQLEQCLDTIESKPGVVFYTLVNADRRARLESFCRARNIPVVSRTSKTPTCIYLANRGYKAGNIPLVPGAPLPTILDGFKKPFIVGLVASPDRIVQIREQRLMGLKQIGKTDYVDQDLVRDEMREAKRMFVRKGYKVIDVTRRSIEETSAQIINLYNKARPVEERRKGLRL